MAAREREPDYFRAPYEDADIRALQALALGVANDVQQKRALDWIINSACATYEVTFMPDTAGASDFMQGRRFAGQRIVKLLKLVPHNPGPPHG